MASMILPARACWRASARGRPRSARFVGHDPRVVFEQHESGGAQERPVEVVVADGSHVGAAGEVDEDGVAYHQDFPAVADGELLLEHASQVAERECPLIDVPGEVEVRRGAVGGLVDDVPAVGGCQGAPGPAGVAVAVEGGGLGERGGLRPHGRGGVGALALAPGGQGPVGGGEGSRGLAVRRERGDLGVALAGDQPAVRRGGVPARVPGRVGGALDLAGRGVDEGTAPGPRVEPDPRVAAGLGGPAQRVGGQPCGGGPQLGPVHGVRGALPCSGIAGDQHQLGCDDQVVAIGAAALRGPQPADGRYVPRVAVDGVLVDEEGVADPHALLLGVQVRLVVVLHGVGPQLAGLVAADVPPFEGALPRVRTLAGDDEDAVRGVCDAVVETAAAPRGFLNGPSTADSVDPVVGRGDGVPRQADVPLDSPGDAVGLLDVGRLERGVVLALLVRRVGRPEEQACDDQEWEGDDDSNDHGPLPASVPGRQGRGVHARARMRGDTTGCPGACR